MPFVNRFLLNQNGAITYAGNTLGLSRSDTVGQPGTIDSIGAFTTIDTSQTFGLYPPGTTSNFQQNSSTALLNLPAGASVLYAELIWGGTYINNGVDFSAFVDDPVSLTTPVGPASIVPDPATAFNVLLSNTPPFPPAYAYVRSADVTAIVQAAGAGAYTTSGVVGTIVVPDPTSNHAVWTLAVAYADPSMPLRNLSIRVGAVVILATSGPVSTVVNGFATPFQGPLDGRAAISAQEGDANKTGDQAQFGPTAATLTTLSGPNNFANNFFASQVNGDNGLLVTTGTFGSRNQLNGTPGSNIPAGRQGYDVTNVSLAGALLNAQTSAVFQLTTNGDGYLVDSVGIQLDIAQPILTIVKSASAGDAVVGDIITYTLTVRNTGSVTASDVQVTDSIDDTSASFVPGSVTLNGMPVPGANPDAGVTVGTLAAGASAVVTFQYQVTAIPFGETLDDQGRVAYTYQPTPGSPVISTFVPSNIVKIPVFQPILSLVKSGDPSPAPLGGIVTYTLLVSNTGNILASVTITDPLPPATTFVPGSVTVRGVSAPGQSPVTGIVVGALLPDTSAVVTFQVQVTSIPPEGELVNQSTAAYTYQPPDGRILTGQTPSNTVIIPVVAPVNPPSVDVVKSAGAAGAIVGETISFTVTATNRSIATIADAVLTDPLPDGYAFVAGSVTVNGVPAPAADPTAGISVGTLASGATSTVTFELTVVTLPDPPVLTNEASLAFTFFGTPYDIPSNPADVDILQPVIGLTKRASAFVAAVGDVVSYSVTATNTGNVAAVVTIVDPLNAYSDFVPGTARVQGVPVPGADPTTGIVAGTVAPGDSIAVSYDVLLTASPPDGFFDNQASAAFTYSSPSGAAGAGSALSNLVRIVETNSQLVVQKTASQSYALVGDRVTYTIVVENVSSAPAPDVVLVDTTTPGAAFVAGSLVVDGVPAAGSIATGISLGTLAPGQRVVVAFAEEIVALAVPDYDVDDLATATFVSEGSTVSSLSNLVVVSVAIPSVTGTKRALTPFAFVGDEVLYEVDITNVGNYNGDIVWSDRLPEGSVFVENSLLLDGVPVPGVNMYTGAFIGTVEAKSTAVVSFKLKVTAFPPGGVLTNQARLDLTFRLPNGRPFTATVSTNPVSVPVLGLATLVKRSSVSTVGVGGSVRFELAVLNPNPQPIDHVFVYDSLPAGLGFVPGSLTVSGAALPAEVTPSRIPVGTVPAGSSVIVAFQALALFAPPNPVVVNSASSGYEILVPGGGRLPRVALSNPVQVLIEEEEE
ncbi:DUF11 domain-containing protein [Paenibacillus albicereus]|uniref:DUF11 domain-containing protein n=1 Tax=Paenibacillus albicereus TaxID=2726185 RepID=A0A6H2H176_9BACL|nr:CARDB domain-containing protein [Paenibacillus albicereus]QJC53441.1 DUF11 domain-containing protein [Paenibacillus albicereus]